MTVGAVEHMISYFSDILGMVYKLKLVRKKC